MHWRLVLVVPGILAGLLGLGIDAWLIFPAVTTVSETNPVARSLPGAFLYFWTYFTHLTNLGLLLVYAATLGRWRWLRWFGRPRGAATMAVYIALVMVYYHVMLGPRFAFEGAWQVATILLHYVTPLLYLLWWGVARPHGMLRWGDVPLLLLPGLAYIAWALARGAVVGEYPYDILDVAAHGYGGVAVGVAILAAAVVLLATLAVLADRLLARRAGTV